MNLFYTKPSRISNTTLQLGRDESKHAIRVLRYKVGDLISVTDGKGHIYKAVITDIDNQKVVAEISDQKKTVSVEPQLSLAIGLIKKRDRLEFAVEKSVELGINKIILYRGDRSEKKRIRIDRIENITLRAMKQSLRYYLPGVEIKNSLGEVLTGQSFAQTIAADETTVNSQKINSITNGHILLIVGPEGGYSDHERKLLDLHDVRKISLGVNRLRTETAAIIMAAKFRSV